MFENIILIIVIVSLALIGFNVYLHAKFEKSIKEFLEDKFKLGD